MKKPRLAVVGIGRYYKKLEAGVLEHFEVVAKVDLLESEAARGNLRRLIQGAGADSVMILTPNHLHAKQIVELADLRLPTLVEKPLVTTEQDLDVILGTLKTNPFLYCSDFYPDVRAVPLLAWLGLTYPMTLKEWVKVEEDQKDLWRQGPSFMGQVTSAEAVLLEGEGDAANFDGREWLWNPVHGGVLWDLAYHFFALWHRVFGEQLSVISEDFRMNSHGKGGQVVETYANLECRASSGRKFFIRVGKYQEGGNERWFRLIGSQGEACLFFRDPNVVRIQIQAGECVATLAGSYYAHVSGAFREYVDSGATQPHGIEAAVFATRLICSLKKGLGNTQVAMGL